MKNVADTKHFSALALEKFCSVAAGKMQVALPHLLVKQLSIVHEFGFQQEFTASPVHRLLNCFYLAVISLNKGIT